MNETILQLLRTKFPGVSDAILGRIAAKLAKTATTEDQAKTAVEGVTIQQVLESYGDSRANEAQRTAVQNYEQKHGLKDGKPIEDDKGDGKGGNKGAGAGDGAGGDGKKDEIPAWAQALIESTNAVKTRLDAMDGNRITETRRQKLSEITQRLPENIRKAYDRTPVDKLSDEEFNQLVTDVTTEVDGIVGSMRSKGAVFNVPPGGQQVPAQLTEAQMKAITSRTGAPAEGQPF